MATREQLEMALINADKAGDVEAARILAGEIQKMRSAQTPAKSYWDRVKQAAKPEQGIFRGMRDPIDAGAQMLVRGANAVGLAPESEISRVDQMNREAEQAYQAQRADSGFDPARLAGNIIATAPLTGAVPVGGSLAARTALGGATGAGFGALQPVNNPGGDFWSQKGEQAKTGAIAGALAAPITGALARIIHPRTSPDVKTLMREGVTPTPGQVLGGQYRAMEEKAKSIPFLGGMVRNAEGRANDQFSRAAVQRALKPIDVKLPEGLTGGAAGQFARRELSKTYDDVINQIGSIAPDDRLAQEITSLGKLVNTLPKDKGEQFVRIIKQEITDRVDKYGRITGEGFKTAQSNLGKQAAAYMRATDGDQQKLGEALDEAGDALKRWLTRVAPPEHSARLAAANEGWANLKRVQRAGSSTAAADGIFSPTQLHQAVKALDRSKDKSAFYEQRALMQDLSSAGKKVLTDKLPNSGTADRLMPVGLGYGLATNPIAVTGAMLPAMAAYTRPGQRAMAGLLASRPELAEPVSNAVRQAGVPILTGGLFGLLGQ